MRTESGVASVKDLLCIQPSAPEEDGEFSTRLAPVSSGAGGGELSVRCGHQSSKTLCKVLPAWTAPESNIHEGLNYELVKIA